MMPRVPEGIVEQSEQEVPEPKVETAVKNIIASLEPERPAETQTVSPPSRPVITGQHSDFTIVAKNPQEMAAAQQSMIEWATGKIDAERQLLADTEANHIQAKKNGWRASAWQARVGSTKKKVEFYEKIKTALEAGYYIVPPFPVEIFAIRTDRGVPKSQAEVGYSETRRDKRMPAERPTPLPEGEGRYVSANPRSQYFGAPEKNFDRTTKEWKETGRYIWKAQDYMDVDFPFKFVKPEVLNAATAAMALKAFDQIGVLPRSASPVTPDPMILGQILAPHRRFAPITFFIAWWLDTKTI